jgi:DNA-binding NarL/FixJ family response regulator
LPCVKRPELSAQDLELLGLLAAGIPAERVARHLELSDRTIRRRLRAVCEGIGVDVPIQAVVWAVRRDLI